MNGDASGSSSEGEQTVSSSSSTTASSRLSSSTKKRGAAEAFSSSSSSSGGTRARSTTAAVADRALVAPRIETLIRPNGSRGKRLIRPDSSDETTTTSTTTPAIGATENDATTVDSVLPVRTTRGRAARGRAQAIAAQAKAVASSLAAEAKRRKLNTDDLVLLSSPAQSPAATFADTMANGGSGGCSDRFNLLLSQQQQHSPTAFSYLTAVSPEVGPATVLCSGGGTGSPSVGEFGSSGAGDWVASAASAAALGGEHDALGFGLTLLPADDAAGSEVISSSTFHGSTLAAAASSPRTATSPAFVSNPIDSFPALPSLSTTSSVVPTCGGGGSRSRYLPDCGVGNDRHYAHDPSATNAADAQRMSALSSAAARASLHHHRLQQQQQQHQHQHHQLQARGPAPPVMVNPAGAVGITSGLPSGWVSTATGARLGAETCGASTRFPTLDGGANGDVWDTTTPISGELDEVGGYVNAPADG